MYFSIIILFLEFHAEVEKERVKAQDALKDIKNIESLIMDAKEKASQAEKILDGSEYKAESAREIAQDAQVSTVNPICNI